MEMWDDHILVLRSGLGQVLLLACRMWDLCIFEDSIVASQSSPLKWSRQLGSAQT
jgi:hypothetical protein